ncbi:DUF2793 domain-containing protein [Halopseudomonas aestusnigri]|uniref:DUF2793 domain-containing protein n=1 Tax=Halopseudomonas aestusnigri TaxID=857252 RepID=UPI0025531131|nr:DUF2793 domain-containing protein [Halopseudomonas aestusnigri]MDL2200656.1 DUF2793 domain-containing protein [Halopseudomonas aestusnigri]
MTTPNLDLPELANSAGNYLRVNEALALLDATVQATVLSQTLTDAPASPADGDRYIMASAWAGVTGAVAGYIAVYRTGSGWIVIEPREGWKVEVLADEITYRYDGSAWGEWSSGGAGGWDALLTPASASGVLTASLAEPAGLAVTLTEDVTDFSLTDIPAGKVVVFTIKWTQDGTGGWAVTWPAAFQGTPAQPATAAGAVTIQSFYTDDGGTTIYQAS